MKRTALVVLAALATLAAIAGCAHTELIRREFDGRTLYIDARVPLNPTIDADCFTKTNDPDPTGNLVSIGASAAKAIQVESAEVRLARALRQVDLRDVIREELGEFFSRSAGMKIVTSRRGTDYRLVVDVRRYGINAYGGVYYTLDGQSVLFDERDERKVWDNWFASEQEVSPNYFDLPDSVEQVITAMTLAALDEETMVLGINQVARAAARQIGTEFDRDLYRARLER